MKSLLILVAICSGINAYSSNNPDAILGIWSNSSNRGHIQVYKRDGQYFGKIIWLLKPLDQNNRPKVDKKNPDEALRSKPLLGLVMLRDFKYEDEEWVNGKIYNPEDGKEYKAYMKLKDDQTLSVRGYIGFSFIGKTETFRRVR